MYQRITALVLCLALTAGALPAQAAEGDLLPSVTEMPVFSDIFPDGSGPIWYDYDSVRICVEAGLMKGAEGAFHPDGEITVAEVATVAARLHAAVTGGTIPEQLPGTPWYAAAVGVMEEMSVSIPSDPLVPIDRAGVVRLLAAVLPEDMTVPINHVSSLPDSSDAEVLRFYNAGILTGAAGGLSFLGDRTLTRSEMAAIAARIVRPSLRRTIERQEEPDSSYGQDAKIMSSALSLAILMTDPDLNVTQGDLDFYCGAAGVQQDDPMLSLGEIQVTAEVYIPVLVTFMMNLIQKLEEEGYSDVDMWSDIIITVDGVRRPVADTAVYYANRFCLDVLILRILDPTAQLDQATRSEYLIQYPMTVHPALETLDVPAFYHAMLGG